MEVVFVLDERRLWQFGQSEGVVEAIVLIGYDC